MVFWSLSCKPSYFVLSLLCRGWFVEWWLCAYPSIVRLILVALCLASKCRGCICNWEKSCVLPVVFAANPQWRFPVWQSCVDELVEILLCEGEDVELGARTSKQISVFAFDPLTLTLSITIVPCIISYWSFIYYMLGLFVCASLVFNHESFI